MNDDDDASVRAEAASAYLDGETDAAERASIAADPDTMALVDSFSKVRDALAAVEPVPDNVRADALSAALAEFDVRQRIRATGPATAVVVRHPRWQRAYPILRGSAAAAVIAVVVFALAHATRGEDSKSSSSATEPPAAAAAPQQHTEAATGLAPAATAAPAATTAGATADSSTQKMAASVPVVNTPEDLLRYASSFDLTTSAATAAPADAGGGSAATELVPVPSAPPATCLTSNDTFLGTVSVLGSPAFAIRDDSTGILRAVATNDCRVLFTVPSLSP